MIDYYRKRFQYFRSLPRQEQLGTTKSFVKRLLLGKGTVQRPVGIELIGLAITSMSQDFGLPYSCSRGCASPTTTFAIDKWVGALVPPVG